MIKIIIIFGVVIGALWLAAQIIPLFLKRKPNPFKEFLRDVNDFYFFYYKPDEKRAEIFKQMDQLKADKPDLAEMIEDKLLKAIFGGRKRSDD